MASIWESSRNRTCCRGQSRPSVPPPPPQQQQQRDILHPKSETLAPTCPAASTVSHRTVSFLSEPVERSRSDLEWLDSWEPPKWIYSEPDLEDRPKRSAAVRTAGSGKPNPLGSGLWGWGGGDQAAGVLVGGVYIVVDGCGWFSVSSCFVLQLIAVVFCFLVFFGSLLCCFCYSGWADC